jgi:16S rRNA (cytidine1402-2'-O)-methyltransferase
LSGNLFVVATPLGNMDDITVRAARVLGISDYILAEDSRVTGGLLNKLGIKTKVFSYHKFTEKKFLEKHIEELKNGKNISLVSDAGTPAVSDPGKYLVRAALDNLIPVIPIPGPSAVSTSFSCSGSMSNSFVFAGFLPSKGAARDKELEKFLSFGLPVIIYESPMRINDLVEKLNKIGARTVIFRELTKQFEEIYVYDGREIKTKGEFTVVAEPPELTVKSKEIDPEFLQLLKNSDLTNKDKAELISRIYPDIPKNEIKKVLIGKNT